MAVYPMEGENWWQRLQPLRVPPGWQFLFNKLEPLEADELDKEDDAWLFHFLEDILYMERKNQRKQNKIVEKQTIGIDLGWYPEGDSNGAYTLVAILNSNWQEPLLEFTSRSTKEIVATIERWLFQEISYGFLEEKEFRRRHSNKS